MKVPITPHHLKNRYYAPPPIAITGNRLTRMVAGYELVDVHELEDGPCRCPSLSDGEMTIYFLANLWFH